MRLLCRTVLSIACLVSGVAFGQQMADPKFDASISNPAYVSEHPKVVIDEAHHNFHTADGRYKPLAELLRNDGYQVVRGMAPFSSASLDASRPAFTQAECEAVRDWVLGGGSLLLISDHTPFGMAAENLASALGVRLGKGFVFALDPKYNREGEPTTLVFSRNNGLLGDHAITRGRNEAERINTVVAFTGQSLSVPKGATALMSVAAVAQEALSRRALRSALRDLQQTGNKGKASEHSSPAHGAQGIAMTSGKGKVVVLGEAAMMSAQVVRIPFRPEVKMGMNVLESDDRQFALNVLHWLSGLLN